MGSGGSNSTQEDCSEESGRAHTSAVPSCTTPGQGQKKEKRTEPTLRDAHDRMRARKSAGPENGPTAQERHAAEYMTHPPLGDTLPEPIHSLVYNANAREIMTYILIMISVTLQSN